MSDHPEGEEIGGPMFEAYGIPVGGALLVVVTAVALGIGRVAARSVREFREEHQESRTERNRP